MPGTSLVLRFNSWLLNCAIFYLLIRLSYLSQMVVLDTVNVMCCRYGSHVFRTLLCLSKGVPADTLQEFHVSKPTSVLAERLNCTSPVQPSEQNIRNFQLSFADVFNFLVKEMLNRSKDEMTTLRVNKYSSFVLQVCIYLLARIQNLV